ncbi:3-isopropylmalate dehydratase large subunit [Natrialbaceae archaeon A-CW2]
MSSSTRTITEKILSTKAGREVTAGDYVEAEIDAMVGHDVTGPLAIDVFESVTGDDGTVANPESVVFTLDHHAPADGVEAANNHNIVREFAETYGTHQYEISDGICHQVMIEEGFVRPGDLIIGADSHSTTYGGLGAFGTGVGSTDLGTVFATGELWFRVPETIRFEVEGTLPDGVYAKDLILRFIGDVGFDGATYKTAEYGGSAIADLPIHQRLVLSNMAIEMGGKAGIVEPDERTVTYLERQSGLDVSLDPDLGSDPDADYEAVYTYRGSDLAPQVSKPSNPENAVDIDEVAGTPVDQVFVGTCTNGRYEDIRAVADVLEGERIDSNTRLIVVPASKTVYQTCLETGVLETLVEAGATFQSAGCGPCAGYHQGVLGDDDVCLATANRNFPGREGSMQSEVYLASPATAGATALYGEITDPRDLETDRYDDYAVATVEGGR